MDSKMVLKESTPNRKSNDSPLSPGTETGQNDNVVYPIFTEENHEELSEGQRAFIRSRSPMQEVVILEQRWQRLIHKLDEVLTTHEEGIITQSSFCHIFSKEETLTILFKLFDWENTGGVKQEKFVDSIRYCIRVSGSQEFIDLVDVLAFVICGEYDICENHFHRIFKSKRVLVKLYKLILKENDGCINKGIIMDVVANLTFAKPRERFTKENLEHLERMFRETLGNQQELCFDDFKRILHSKNPFFVERVFQVFDRDKNGSVSLSEFLDAMHQFTGKSPNEKLQFLFRVYDVDGDGLVQREELEKVMKACMEENGMAFSDDQIEDLTSVFFEDADTENRGEITFEDLKAQIQKHTGLLENLSISIDRWLLPTHTADKKQTNLKKNFLPYQLTLPYLKNNYVYLLFLLFIFSVNVFLFVDRALSIAETGENMYYILARACGQCLNFNCTLILVLVLRHSLTFLRSRGVASYLPLDQSLYFHKMVGFVILFHSLLHTIMHLFNFTTVIVYNESINSKNLTAVEWLLTSKPGIFGLIPGWANPTGVILIVALIIMVICSLPFVRKSGSFQVFYWTHMLYVLFFVLTILHAPKFWKWFIVPGIIFCIEKVFRAIQMSSGHRKSYISSGILLPSKVIHLVIEKPNGFHFHPGDYIFVNVPTIAKYEWHPFTISSAPEQEDAVWLHIRAVGQWTNRLYEYFQKQQQLCEKSAIFELTNILKEDTKIIMETSSHENDPIQIQDSKFGVVNDSYEQDTSEIKDQEGEIVKEETAQYNEGESVKEIVPSIPIRLRRNRANTSSVPDFDKKIRKREKNLMIRNYFRTNSENQIDEAKLKNAYGLGNSSGSAMLFPTNRSVAQSIRYLRRKPKVVTLDMPADDSGIENEGTSNEQVCYDPTIYLESGEHHTSKPSLVRLASNKILQKKKTISVDQASLRAKRQSRMKEAEALGQYSVGKPLVIYLDGAYGAPSSHIFRAQHAVLIGTGIGVTPFASILQSIMHRYLKVRQTCPKCEHTWSANIPQAVMNLRKVDFFWINRDQRSFEWFVNLLSQLEIEQAEQGSALERFLDMHMYITSALQKTDMKAVGLQLAMDLLHDKEKRDLITGLKTRTNAGRPNWDKVFKQLLNQNKGKITVFYCGPPALGRILRYKCSEFGFEFRKEIF